MANRCLAGGHSASGPENTLPNIPSKAHPTCSLRTISRSDPCCHKGSHSYRQTPGGVVGSKRWSTLVNASRMSPSSARRRSRSSMKASTRSVDRRVAGSFQGSVPSGSAKAPAFLGVTIKRKP